MRPRKMFHIDTTFEDLRIVVSSEDGGEYEGVFVDNHSGKTINVEIGAGDLTAILAFNLDHDGEPVGHEQMRANLQPFLAKYDLLGENRVLCPIP